MKNKVNKCGLQLATANGLTVTRVTLAVSERFVSLRLKREWVKPALANVELIEDLEVLLEQGR